LRISCFLGVVAIAVGWVTIISSIAVNPWFSVTTNALSDLGAITVGNRMLFNVGLAVAGMLSLGYTCCLVNSARNKLGVFAAGVYSLASVHLLLIAVFPEGTGPHWFVSVEFFVLTGVSIPLLGVALIVAGARRHGLMSMLWAVAGFVGSAVVEWPSIALLEIYNLALITAWILTMVHYHVEDFRWQVQKGPATGIDSSLK